MAVKRGVFFTGVALMFVAAVILGYTMYDSYSLREQSALEGIRIRTMNSFAEDLETDLQRSLYIATFRALLGASQYITDNGLFLDDTQDQLEELVLYGTINGSTTNMTSDSFFYEWVSRVTDVGDNIGVDVSFSTPTVTFTQSTPWSVTARLDTVVIVSDDIQNVKWERTKSVRTTISILEFEDPLYTVSSGKQVINTIRETPYTSFVSGTDTTNLTLHAQSSFYVPSDSGPSYLMRLEGDTGVSGDGMGIESLIDIDQLSFLGLNTNYSVVDYVYWGALDNTSYWINNTNFRLDNMSNHLAEYQVTGLINGS